MKKLNLWVLMTAACLFSMAAPATHAQDPSHKKETVQNAHDKAILQNAHDAYCNLRTQGLVELQATIKPNWEVVLGDQVKKDPKSAEAGLKMLNGLHFTMTLHPDDNVKVDHSSDAPPPNEQAAAGFEQIYSGMSQAVDGFFSTWSLFMLKSPFPDPASEYQLEEIGGQYRLAWRENTDDVVANLNKNLVMTEIMVTSKNFKSTIKPQFARTPKGFILSGYEADYLPTTGPGVVHLKIKIDYQEVSGLQLPSILDMDSTYDGQPNRMELHFSDYQVQKK